MSSQARSTPVPRELELSCAISGVAELTLEARDLASMEDFYRRLLGLELLDREDDRVWLAIDDRIRLGLWSPGEKEFGDRGGRHVHFALSITPGGLDGLAERLRCGQVDVQGPIEHRGGDRSIYFQDPAGNVVEAWDFFQRGEGARNGVDALK